MNLVENLLTREMNEVLEDDLMRLEDLEVDRIQGTTDLEEGLMNDMTDLQLEEDLQQDLIDLDMTEEVMIEILMLEEDMKGILTH